MHDICSTSNLVHPPFKVKFFNMINLFGLLQDMCSTSNLVNPSFNMFYLETTYMIELTTFQSKDKFILKMKKKQKNVFLVIGCII